MLTREWLSAFPVVVLQDQRLQRCFGGERLRTKTFRLEAGNSLRVPSADFD